MNAIQQLFVVESSDSILVDLMEFALENKNSASLVLISGDKDFSCE